MEAGSLALQFVGRDFGYVFDKIKSTGMSPCEDYEHTFRQCAQLYYRSSFNF